nr:MAG TPA: Iron/manganese superoxide dismutase [Caudoviricetes sp.]
MIYLASIVSSSVPLLRCDLWYAYSIDYVCTNVKQK